MCGRCWCRWLLKVVVLLQVCVFCYSCSVMVQFVMVVLRVVVEKLIIGVSFSVMIVFIIIDQMVKWNGWWVFLWVKYSGCSIFCSMKVGRFVLQIVKVSVVGLILVLRKVLCWNRIEISGQLVIISVMVVGMVRNSVNLVVWLQVQCLFMVFLVFNWCDMLGSRMMLMVMLMMFNGS